MAMVCGDGFLLQMQALSRFAAGWREHFFATRCGSDKQETSQMSCKPTCMRTFRKRKIIFKKLLLS